MSFLNIGYISKALKERKNLFILFLFVIISIPTIFVINFIQRPTMSLYRFNSGLNLSFNLDKWRVLPGATNGDTLINQDNTVSILLTSARVEDTTKSLSQIVEERVSLLDKENLEIKQELIKINNMDFFRVEYSDKGDENIKPDEGGISFITLHNNVYTTAQVFYKKGADTKEALEIINTIKAN